MAHTITAHEVAEIPYEQILTKLFGVRPHLKAQGAVR
jgi:hypothetical protein